MSWLYGQTWLWYLIAFLVGLLLAWLVFVRPAQRRLGALLSGSADADAAASSTGGRSAAGTGAAGVAAAAAAGVALTKSTTDATAGTRTGRSPVHCR